MLVHSRDRILPELAPELADYAMRKLKARGIEFMLNTRVTGATAEGMLVGDGQLIPARTVVWTAGNQPNPILRALPCERSKAGAVVVEPTLRVKGFDNVWAVGDCAQVPDPEKEGQFYPPTAQHAIREGKAAAGNIAAAIRGGSLKPFRFHAIGILVPLGHRTGAAEIRGVRFSGLLAWLMWRTVYLNLLPGLERKVRVSFDWLFDLLFPRDIVLTASPDRPRTPDPKPPTPGAALCAAGTSPGKASSRAPSAAWWADCASAVQCWSWERYPPWRRWCGWTPPWPGSSSTWPSRPSSAPGWASPSGT